MTSNKKYAKEYAKRYWKTSRGKEALARALGKYHRKSRIELMLFLGGMKCIRCGFTDIRALQIDHINGDGYKESFYHRQGGTKIRYYINHKQLAKKRLQVLCANCNWIKRHINNETHHKYKR